MVKILSIKQQQTWLKSIKNKKGKAYFSGKITGKTSKDFKSAVKSYQSYLKSKEWYNRSLDGDWQKYTQAGYLKDKAYRAKLKKNNSKNTSKNTTKSTTSTIKPATSYIPPVVADINNPIVINKKGLYAFDIDLETPTKEQQYAEIEIESEMTRYYKTNIKGRAMSFKAPIFLTSTLTRQSTISWIDSINGKTIDFSSIYIGSFKALCKAKPIFEDGFPDFISVEISVIEITEVY